MSRHDPCCLSAVHNGSATFSKLRRELQAKRIKLACQPIKPGEGPEAQISNGAKRFDITYDEGWRAWRERASQELCDKMDARWPAVEAYLRELKARALADFILEMQAALDGTRPRPLEAELLPGFAGLPGFPVFHET